MYSNILQYAQESRNNYYLITALNYTLTFVILLDSSFHSVTAKSAVDIPPYLCNPASVFNRIAMVETFVEYYHKNYLKTGLVTTFLTCMANKIFQLNPGDIPLA